LICEIKTKGVDYKTQTKKRRIRFDIPSLFILCFDCDNLAVCYCIMQKISIKENNNLHYWLNQTKNHAHPIEMLKYIILLLSSRFALARMPTSLKSEREDSSEISKCPMLSL